MKQEDKNFLLEHAVDFEFKYPTHEVYISFRGIANGVKQYVVRDNFRRVLNHDLKWETEPVPSNRTDEFIARTRSTLEECLKLIKSS